MVVRFVTGRAGTGKTEHCLRAAIEALGSTPESTPLVLVVPEQASFEVERTLLERSPTPALSRLEVLTFTRIAQRLLAAGGRARRVLTASQRQLALRAIVARAPGRFAGLESLRDTAGLYEELDRVTTALTRAMATPDELNALLDGEAFGRRAVAVGEVYAAYRAWLQQEGTDPADQLRVAANLVADSWLRGARLWVDGFAELQSQETALLVALARAAEETTITLLCDPAAVDGPPDELDIFRPIAEQRARLEVALRAGGVTIGADVPLAHSPPRFREPALGRLEAGWPNAGQRPDPRGVAGDPDALAERAVVLECDTPREELRRCARWVRRKVAAGEARYRDFAVIFRDAAPYAALVEEVFSEYELPCFVDRRRPLAAHALVRLVLGVLDVVRGDFRPEATARLLRTRLLPLREREADLLERWVLEHEVRGVRLWRRPAWDFGGGRGGGAGGDPDHYASARQALVEALDPLIRAHHDGPLSAAEWVRALRATIAQLGTRERLAAWIDADEEAGRIEAAESHRQVWSALVEVLHDIETVLAGQPLATRDFAAVLRSTLRGQTIGLAPPTLDQVLVTSIQRSRHPEVQYAWLAGFNDGVFPARAATAGLLSRADREALAQRWPELRPPEDRTHEERLLAYIACTRPSEGLVISYSRTLPGGAEGLPSPLLDALREAQPWLRVRRQQEHLPPVGLRDFARQRLEARGRGSDPQVRADYRALENELRGNLLHSERTRGLLRGVGYRNDTCRLPGFDAPDDAPSGLVWRGSPSRVTRYLDCPFRYFAERGLRLRVARRPTPESLALGDLAHRLLADVIARVVAAGPVTTAADGDWLAALEAALATAEGAQDADLAARQPGRRAQFALLGRALREHVLAQAARYRLGTLTPVGCEVAFGDPGCELEAAGAGPDLRPALRLPPLRIELGDGRFAEIHGRIDRIDRCVVDGQSFDVVIDYKSKTEPLVSRDVYVNNQLQLMIYLLAVEQAGSALAGGGLIAPLWPTIEAGKRAELDALEESHRRLTVLKPRGIFDERTADAWDRRRPADSHAVVLKRNKDKSVSRRSDARPADDVQLRLDRARRLTRDVAGGIVSGALPVMPLSHQNTLPCRFCDLRAVCRFELGPDRVRLSTQLLQQPGGAAHRAGEDDA